MFQNTPQNFEANNISKLNDIFNTTDGSETLNISENIQTPEIDDIILTPMEESQSIEISQPTEIFTSQPTEIFASQPAETFA